MTFLVHTGLANRYVSAGHGSNLWSSACFCSSLSFHLAVTARWQGGAQRTICTAEVLSHARRLRVISGHFAVQSPCPLYPRKRKWFSTVMARAAASTRRTRALMTMPTNVLRLMDANRVGLAKASLNDNV